MTPFCVYKKTYWFNHQCFQLLSSKFTIYLRITKKNSINFLDMTLISSDNHIITNWFQKPTASGRFWNYFLNHPLQQKKNIVYNLIDRVILLSHESFHRTNLKKVEQLLINNDYPSSFIDNNIKIRMNKIKYHSSNNSNIRNNSFCPQKYQQKVCLPFSNNNFITLSKIKKKILHFYDSASGKKFKVNYQIRKGFYRKMATKQHCL